MISEATRKKMSEAHKGLKMPARSEEWRERQRKAQKGKKRGVMPEGVRKKIGDAQRGQKNHRWGGDKIGYQGIHKWIRRTYGDADRCENKKCPQTSRHYEWANRSGKYLRKRSDWMRLCHPCHTKYDGVRGFKKGNRVWKKEIRST